MNVILSNNRNDDKRKKEHAKKMERQEKELKQLEKSFDKFIKLMTIFEEKVEINDLHPRVFGMKLTGALFKAVVGTIIACVIGVVRFIVFPG